MKKIPYYCFGINVITFSLLSLLNTNFIKGNIEKNNFFDVMLNNTIANYENEWIRFENQLRKIIDYDYLNSEYINFIKEISVNNEIKKVYYIDFIAKEGYVVLDDDKIYEYDFDIDLTELESIEFLYDKYDKFIYIDDEGIIHKIYDDLSTGKLSESLEIIVGDSIVLHEGQNEAGDGEIYDLDAYVEDRYPGYTLDAKLYIKNYQWVDQMDTSYYVKYTPIGDTGLTFKNSEPNCILNASYSLLSNLPTTMDPNSYSYNYNENLKTGKNIEINYRDLILKDSLYSQYGTNRVDGSVLYNGTYYASYWRINGEYASYSVTEKAIEHIPMLYDQLRCYAINNNYYSMTDGASSQSVPTILKSINSYYEYDIDYYFTTSISTVAQSVRNAVPGIIFCSNSETYNAHAMVVYGYAVYKKTTTNFWGVESTDYKYFFTVDSGQGPVPTNPYSYAKYQDDMGFLVNWFDANICTYNFLVVNRNTLVWPEC